MSGSGVALVRPESLGVDSDGIANATVNSVHSLGPISRVYADADGHGTVMAAIPSRTAASFRPGQRVSVRVDPAPLLVIAAD